VTHHPIKVLPDGTRRYSNYTKYKPLTPEQRTYGVNKPDDPRAVRFHGTWFLPLEVLSDPERTMPETVPDDVTLSHRAICKCFVCKRPGASEVWRKARQRRRVKP
jgi:hypothetical protein